MTKKGKVSSYGSVTEGSTTSTGTGTGNDNETTPLVANKNGRKNNSKEEHRTSSTHNDTNNNDEPNWFSNLTFGWFSPILELGNEKLQLDPTDLELVALPPNCSTNHIQSAFRQFWNIELEKAEALKASGAPAPSSTTYSWLHSPSLLLALYHSFGLDFLKAGFLKLVHDLCIFVGPQVLHGLVFFLRDASAPLSQGLYLTAAVTVSQLTMSFCLRHYFFKCYRTGLQVRSAVVVSVYEKALKLQSSERQVRSIGEITNLLSIDAQRMQELTTYLHAIWYSIIQIGLALFFLWQQLGAASLGGVVIMIIMMPITKLVAQWLGGIQKSLMAAKDNRVNVNSEVLGNMKVIKLQAWEEPFAAKLLELRETELKELWHYIVAQALSILLWSTTPLAVAMATFTTYILLGHKLEVASALTSLALFDILRFPLFMLPQVINRIVEASVSMDRIQSFLQCEEYVAPSKSAGSSKKDPDRRISMENATYCYESRKPRVVPGVDADPMMKDLLDKQWEIQLLQSQLKEAERNLATLEQEKQGVIEKQVDENEYTINDYDTELQDTAPDLLCLKRINFSCKKGELVAVIGGVGCGKSSFVQAILGEIRQLSSDAATAVDGTISYFAQSPFILNDTVRRNILFGHARDDRAVNEALYQTSLSSCALTHDLQLLGDAGDETEIGEKGITLSGGQKARVALARTVYHDADIAILDDPLAAVDAHVGSHLFQECILNQLLLNKQKENAEKRTVVLITNALQYLSHPLVDRILVLQNGRIIEQGSYTELTNNQESVFSNFLSVMAESGVSPTTTTGCGAAAGLSIDDDDDVPATTPLKVVDQSDISHEHNDDDGFEEIMKDESTLSATSKTSVKKSDGKLMTSEFKERVVGSVDKDVYLAWGKAAGGAWIPLVIVIVYGMVEVVNVLSKWWLTYWSNHGNDESQLYFLGIYAVINLSAVLATFLRLVILMSCGLRASRKLFARLLEVVMQAPMSFFDTTPIGRIINRFSSDMYTVDVQLVSTLRSYLSTLFTICSTIVVISTVTPVFALCLIPILIYYSVQQAYFTISYRELKRLDSIGRSPIYALLGETLDGVATIRSFGAQDTLADRLNGMLDRQQHAYYLITAAQCWLAIRLELVGTMIITFACLSSVLQHGQKGGDEAFAGLAGLAISYSLTVTQSLNWSVRMASDFEANMVAVERVDQYSNINSEADRKTPTDTIIPANWPEKGEIQFKGSKLRYRQALPLVLKGLDIHIPAGAKVGIVGRTGAGKSTLMVAMLRIVELCEGKVVIDGVDHSSVGLAKLRSKIAVIPQDPVLFSGTIRSNLDPFEEFADERLLDVLERVGLYGTIQKNSSSQSLSSLGGQIHSLQDSVADSGSNYSVGQRQLLVIARALLCGSNIVIMDEATAAVDADTDSRIQKVMRNDFRHATCLTVAHRINTILDSDYILVMSDGQAAEFDTPQTLMNRGGLFRDLVEAAGREGDMASAASTSS